MHGQDKEIEVVLCNSLCVKFSWKQNISLCQNGGDIICEQ